MSAKYVVILNFFAAALLCLRPAPAVASPSVRLTWAASSSPDIAGYNVYYGLDSGVYTTVLSSGAATELNIGALEEGLTYYFAVTAYISAGQESGLSNEASYSVPGIAPPDGSPFIQQILPDHAVTLGWNPSPSPTVNGYHVYYGTQSGLYNQAVWVPAGTEVEVHNLADGVTYYFAVAASTGSGGESVLTAEIAYVIPGLVPPQAAPTLQPKLPDHAVTLTWPASPSADVAGYKIYYGPLSGFYDQWFYVGNTTTVDVGGLMEGATYFFAVAAYDSAGQESVPSAETSYYVQPVVTVVPPVLLSLQQLPAAGFPNVFGITATGPVPAAWTVEGSPDLKSWRTLATGADSEVNVTVVVTEKPALFFRLRSWFEDIPLQLQAPATNAFPNALVVSTADAVPWDWTLESSENLADWSPLASGFFAPVNVAVVNQALPALFFRLKAK